MTVSKPIIYDHGARIAERARQNNSWDEPGITPSANSAEDAPMREASIILPLTTDNGDPAIEAHAMMLGALLDDFGGFTEETVRRAGGTKKLWDDWCAYVAKRQPNLYRDTEHVSSLHLIALGLN